jgi:SAM-dependent methyltransferase
MLELLAQTLPARRLLDAGCGDGRYLAAVAGQAELTGVDISERILATAAMSVADAGADATLVRANIEQLPFADCAFDRVLSVQVIEHLVAPELGLSELARVLEPDGLLVLSTDNTHARLSAALNLPRRVVVSATGLRGRHRRIEFPHVSFTCDDVERLVASAGLELVHLETFRVHFDALFGPRSLRALAWLDERLPSGRWGDLIAVVARKPLQEA